MSPSQNRNRGVPETIHNSDGGQAMPLTGPQLPAIGRGRHALIRQRPLVQIQARSSEMGGRI